jgi:hypothetical protein
MFTFILFVLAIMIKTLKKLYHKRYPLCPWWCHFKAYRKLKKLLKKEGNLDE